MRKKHQEIIQMIKIQSITIPDKKMKLRAWLDKVRLSVKDLSEIIGVSRSYVHMILLGQKIPSLELLDRVRILSVGKVSELRDLRD